jgi:hypothetical protein
MAKPFRPFDRDQMPLMPPALADWVPEDHLARFVGDVVETLDLSAIEESYSEDRGYPPYAAPLAAARGRPPQGLSVRDRMVRKLTTLRGRRIYARRKAIVEPVFGQIKHARGFRQFLRRGLERVQQEWGLICLSHNLLKLHAVWSTT